MYSTKGTSNKCRLTKSHVAVSSVQSAPDSDPVACTINIYDRRFYDRNNIGLYYNTLETIVIDDPSLS